MRSRGRWIFTVVLLVQVCAWSRAVEAAAPEVSLELVPLRQVFVHGDEGKFRAQHWMSEGAAGGVKQFSLDYTLPDGTQFTGEGHALIDQNDLGGAFSLKKEKLGFVNLDFSEFRKYFDNNGGVYRRFTDLQHVDVDRELTLDMGKLELETGLTLEGWPELTFQYEHEFKQGTKSRLTWVGVTDEALMRKIAPSWQAIDEVVDVFALKAAHEVRGFALSGEQRWEFARSENLREEAALSTNNGYTTPPEQKIRRQPQDPQAMLATTTLGVNRSFLEDKAFVSTGYHYAQLRSREVEHVQEYDRYGTLTSYSYPEQRMDSYASNKYHTHTWVGNLMVSPVQSLTVGTKLKAEVLRRNSNSSYPAVDSPNAAYGATPDSVLDHTEASITDNKAAKWGESFSIRYTGIPRAALYNELDLEQVRVLLREDRKSIDGPSAGNLSSATEVFNRETVTKIFRGVWTLGGQAAPWSFLNVTAQVRHRQSNIDYDDQRESAATTTARSAFFDGQNIATNEFATRWTLKPCRWFRPSFRYQLRGDKYATRAENEPIVKTGMLSHIYTYDVTLQPREDLLTTVSFSQQQASTWTPARLTSDIPQLPAFKANVHTWLLSTEYTPTPTLVLTSALQYTGARNFNDYAALGIPYGADFDRVDVTTGIQWTFKENTKLEAEYGFYSYQPNRNAEFGGYEAHLIQLEISKKF